ncbi:MAG: carbonic anhydrase family protein [Rhodothermaceae bacterium]|nr:carbonic anhydrase family protein [Rhodothermaceae bacterium]
MKADRLALYTLFCFFVIVGCAEQAQEDMSTAEAQEPEAAPMEKTAWTYEGDGGPDAWGSLDDAYGACSAGVEQSPIALVSTDAESSSLPALSFTYGEATLTVNDSGHGYTATPDGSHMLSIGDDTYNLLQFHAHTPSEHTLDGEYFPMAVHFVHQSEAGELAVVGVLISSGEANPAYDAYTSLSEGGEASPVALMSMLPEDLTYMTYPGSLTTPPCSEGVRWNVLTTPITMSPEQIEVFAAAHGDTNRPVMPLGERSVRVSE